MCQGKKLKVIGVVNHITYWRVVMFLTKGGLLNSYSSLLCFCPFNEQIFTKHFGGKNS